MQQRSRVLACVDNFRNSSYNIVWSILTCKEKKFFTLFEKASGNLLAISKMLVEMVNSSSPEKRKEPDDYAH